jgi:uracil-DNA glycosylase
MSHLRPLAPSFEELRAAIRGCRHCAAVLPHEPRPIMRGLPSARILISGQAPGTRVHASGIPFDDPSGVRLREWLGLSAQAFYDETRVAIVPMGFCYPGLGESGADLPPRPECAGLWRARLLPHFAHVRLTIAVGLHAQGWHLGTDAKRTLTDTVAHWRDYGPRVMPLPHPSWRNNAWLKRNPWFERELLPVLRRRVHEALS